MEQGIEIKKTGICQECILASLELREVAISNLGGRIWAVTCDHKDACLRAFDEGYKEGRKQAIMTVNGYMTEIEARKLYEARSTTTRP